MRLGDYGYLERARVEGVPPNLPVAAVDKNKRFDTEGRKRSSLTLEEFQRGVAQGEEELERKLRDGEDALPLVPLPAEPKSQGK